MVPASKVRTAQETMRAARPHADKMRNVIAHMAYAHSEYHHPFLHEREVRRVGYIVISSDRGLCGGLNINLFKAAVASLKEWQDKGVEADICAIGKKGISFFTRIGGNIISERSQLGDKPSANDLIGSVKVMRYAYNAGPIARL